MHKISSVSPEETTAFEMEHVTLLAADLPHQMTTNHDMSYGDMAIQAVLALVRLDQIIPSEMEVAMDHSIDRQLRIEMNTLGWILLMDWCGDRYNSFGSLPIVSSHLLRLNEAYRRALIDHGRRLGDEYVYLCTSLMIFLRQALSQVPDLPRDLSTEDEVSNNPTQGYGMILAIAEVFQKVVGDVVFPDLLRDIRELSSGDIAQEEHTLATARLLESYVTRVCNLVQAYVETLANISAIDDSEQNAERVSNLIRIFQEPLKEYVREELSELLQNLGVHMGLLEPDENSNDPLGYCKVFIRRLARFFSFCSPLVQHLSLETESFDAWRFQLNDQHQTLQELEGSELEDVLSTAQTVTLGDVSTLFPALPDSECGICFDSHDTMRRIVVCSHVFCDECLAAQLRTHHPSRYRCATCRGRFFSDGRV